MGLQVLWVLLEPKVTLENEDHLDLEDPQDPQAEMDPEETLDHQVPEVINTNHCIVRYQFLGINSFPNYCSHEIRVFTKSCLKRLFYYIIVIYITSFLCRKAGSTWTDGSYGFSWASWPERKQRGVRTSWFCRICGPKRPCWTTGNCGTTWHNR